MSNVPGESDWVLSEALVRSRTRLPTGPRGRDSPSPFQKRAMPTLWVLRRSRVPCSAFSAMGARLAGGGEVIGRGLGWCGRSACARCARSRDPGQVRCWRSRSGCRLVTTSGRVLIGLPGVGVVQSPTRSSRRSLVCVCGDVLNAITASWRSSTRQPGVSYCEGDHFGRTGSSFPPSPDDDDARTDREYREHRDDDDTALGAVT